MIKLIFLFSILFCSGQLYSQNNPAKKTRDRDLAIPFDGKPGNYNAVTDVPGVLAGYKTIIKEHAQTATGNGPVRTGVTVIFPKEKTNEPPLLHGLA